MNELIKSCDHSELIEIIEDRLKNCQSSNSLIALIIVQLKDINNINTSLNYCIGNLLYSDIGLWLTQNMREQDTVHALTHDKYAILLKGIRNKGHAILAANKVLEVGSHSFSIDRYQLFTNISLGIALSQNDCIDAVVLLQKAEIALEHAVKNNKVYEVHSPDFKNSYSTEFNIKFELEKALEQGEFTVVYQPKINLIDHLPCGAEALLRWNNASFGSLSPGVFLSYIENTPNMIQITDFVLNKALRDQLDWEDYNYNIPVSVNLSPIVLQQPEVEEMIKRTIAIWGNKPSSLTLEITETNVMENVESNFEILRKIREYGFSISIDDFGTGYSSLAYFKNIPADEIKIDKSFVSHMIDNEADHKLVRTIIDLAHSFNHTVVAEGVEDQATLNALQNLGCDSVQGYFFSKPLAQDDFIEWLNNFQELCKNQI